MPQSIFAPFHDQILPFMQQAMETCRAVQNQLIEGQTFTKEDRSPVTIADYASQIILIHGLKTIAHDIPITAEEDASDLKKLENADLLRQVMNFCQISLPTLTEKEALDLLDAGNHPGGPEGTFWTIDPIDGTKGFLRGEQYAVALAGIHDGIVEIGFLGCPNLDVPTLEDTPVSRLFSAVRNQGAFVRAHAHGAPVSITVDSQTQSDKLRFCGPVESAHTSHTRMDAIAEILKIEQEPLRMDSQCKYAACASGASHAYLRLPTRPGYEEKIWDHAAGLILVEEAGGKVTDIHGTDLNFSCGETLKKNQGIVATNGSIHQPVLEAIKQTTE